MSSLEYAPPGESAADLWLERSNFAGVFVGGVAYGIHTAVFAAATYFIISAYKASKRLPWSFLIFIFSLFTLGTIDIACNTKFGEMMWIDDRNIPGGPNAWLEAGYSTPVNVLGNASYIFSNFLADAMIIYRLWVIWSYNWYIIIIPILSFLASTALSILTIYETAQPGASLWSHITLGFAVPYWSLSIALNILVTLAIVYRLVAMKRRIGRLLSPAHSRMYTSLSSMVIESAALYSITGMIFIICYARSSNVQNIVLPILGQVMCIAPELIILRVARGRAWSSNTVTLLEGTTATGPKYITRHSQLHSDTTDVEGAELGQVFPFYATEVSRNGPDGSDSGGESPLTRGKKSSLNIA